MIETIKTLTIKEGSKLSLSVHLALELWQTGKGSRTEFFDYLGKWVNVSELDNLLINDIYYWYTNAPKGDWNYELEETYRFLSNFYLSQNPNEKEIKIAIHGALFCLGELLSLEQDQYKLNQYRKTASDLWKLQQL